MAARVNTQAQSFRNTPQAEMMERIRADFAKFMGILEGLTEGEWGGLLVPHFYMGPLPAFFYPAFQLMDYGVHSWDIRQGQARARGWIEACRRVLPELREKAAVAAEDRPVDPLHADDPNRWVVSPPVPVARHSRMSAMARSYSPRAWWT